MSQNEKRVLTCPASLRYAVTGFFFASLKRSLEVAGVEPKTPNLETPDKQSRYESQEGAHSHLATLESGTQWNSLAEVVKIWAFLTPESQAAILGLVRAMKGEV